MKKVFESSVKKVLSKTEQKAIIGGICYDPRTGESDYPIDCWVNGRIKKVCPHLCKNWA